VPHSISRILVPALVILALLLSAVWLTFSYLRASQFGLLNLDYRADVSRLEIPTHGDLQAGDIVTGQFVTPYPNLGLISVRFFNQNRDSDDSLIFRLRRSDSADWIYQHAYETNQFLPHEHFSFGFPIQPGSAGQSYTFELESTRGATGSGILIDPTYPVFIAKSTFDRVTLQRSPTDLLYWGTNKLANIISDRDVVIHTGLYFLPLAIYLLYLLTAGVSYQPLTALALGIVAYDIFFLTESYDHLYLSLILLWSLLIYRYRFDSQISSGMALILLIITPIFILFGADVWSERVAVWAFLYLSISVGQQIYEARRPQKKSLSVSRFLTNFPHLHLDPEVPGARLIKSLVAPSLILFSLSLLRHVVGMATRTYELYYSFFPTQHLLQYLTYFLLPATLASILLIVISHTYRARLQPLFRLVVTLLIWTLAISYLSDISTRFRDDVHITGITPSTVSEAWLDVGIRGHNFAGMPFVGRVEIDGVEQRVIRWSDKLIYFRTQPNHTRSGELCITRQDGRESNCLPFEYHFGQ
jgi:hypothetical protein